MGCQGRAAQIRLERLQVLEREFVALLQSGAESDAGDRLKALALEIHTLRLAVGVPNEECDRYLAGVSFR